MNRYTPLVAQKAVSQAELDKATSMQKAGIAKVEAAQAVLDNAKLDLGLDNGYFADFRNCGNCQSRDWRSDDADHGHDDGLERESSLR